MIHIEIMETGERRRIAHEIWITTNRNGIISTPHRVKALGVGDGETVWSLGGLAGYPEAKIITLSEYEEGLTPPDEDPELTAEEALAIMMGGTYETE